MTARALPRSLEDLRGHRAARWVRESTAGQADNSGPDAQAEQQARAIDRSGLVDTGDAWQVAHCGRTIAATGHRAEMLDGAGRDWDVLVVGYVSRFARDLPTAVNARHDLHARVAVSSTLKASAVPIARKPDRDGGDVLARARIKREREQAALRFANNRDLAKLEATMARLDAEAAAAVVRPSRTATATEARDYLESLPDLWAKTSDAGRHAIAEAVFERIDVLGESDFTFSLTAHAKARGWDAAFGAGVVRVKEGRSGRGERARARDQGAPEGVERLHPARSGRSSRSSPRSRASGAGRGSRGAARAVRRAPARACSADRARHTARASTAPNRKR